MARRRGVLYRVIHWGDRGQHNGQYELSNSSSLESLAGCPVLNADGDQVGKIVGPPRKKLELRAW